MQSDTGVTVMDEREDGDSAVGKISERLRRAVLAARQGLLALQKEDGHWCAELEGDTILESEYILCLFFLNRGHEDRVLKLANYVRSKQRPEGGWSTYPGGPADVSVSVKAYLALKLAGDEPDAPHMRLASRTILELGGVEAVNSFTQIYLSIFGLNRWGSCPAVPPEMILLPKLSPFNIYTMSSWSRAIVVPLSIIWALKPHAELPVDLAELHSGKKARRQPGEGGLRGRMWAIFFAGVNSFLKGIEGLRLRPLRRRALRRAESWTLEHLQMSDGIGAIFPPIINTLIALRALEYPLEHPLVLGQMRELEKLEIEEGDTLRVQPCFSPVWDTTLAIDALLQSGVPATDPALHRAAHWLLDKEVRHPGDWRVYNPEGPVGGWYFEYANEFYPDCDDTAEVLKTLGQVRFEDPLADSQRLEAMQRGEAWLRSMQNRDGGWAAFDKGCDKEFLTYIPFADHNAMIDPSTSDITSRCIESLHLLGASAMDPAIRRAVRFLERQQEPEGCWYGRWGCNYLYGTWLVLRGLRAIGHDIGGPAFQRAADWLVSVQNPDGGWGELPTSYDDPGRKGEGPSTASQTAWALMALYYADYSGEAIQKGIDYLLRTQRQDGTWKEEPWTGTGFPKVFYLRYHLYATYFPLQALGMYGERMVRVGDSGRQEARERAA